MKTAAAPVAARRPVAVALLVVLAALGARPVQAVDARAERARIAAERRAVTERLDRDEAACAGRFAVNACIADVRQQRRDALRRLREQELLLDDEARRARAAQRARDIEGRRIEADARPAPMPMRPANPVPTASMPRPSPRRAAAASAPGPAAAALGAAPAASAGELAASRAATRQAQAQARQATRQAVASRRAAQAEQRRAQIQARQRKIDERIKRQQAEPKKAAPLPDPGGS